MIFFALTLGVAFKPFALQAHPVGDPSLDSMEQCFSDNEEFAKNGLILEKTIGVCKIEVSLG